MKNCAAITDRIAHPIEIYNDVPPLLPEVPSMGWGIFRRAAMGGPRPQARQGDIYEYCYIARGSVEWWIGDTLHEIGPGCAFINLPGEWHGGSNAMLHPCEVYWVQVDLGCGFPGLPPADAEALVSHLRGLTYRFFPAPLILKAHHVHLLAEYQAPDAHAPISARGLLHTLLATVIRAHDAHQAREAQPLSPAIQCAVDWIDAHIGENFSQEQVAGVAGMSSGYFYRRFAREVGYTPGDYRTRRRIYRARYLLRQPDLSILDIALAVGFSSSQYFATTFKKVVGMTPGDYRQVVGSASARPPHEQTQVDA